MKADVMDDCENLADKKLAGEKEDGPKGKKIVVMAVDEDSAGKEVVVTEDSAGKEAVATEDSANPLDR